jgi:hypothetical protein
MPERKIIQAVIQDDSAFASGKKGQKWFYFNDELSQAFSAGFELDAAFPNKGVLILDAAILYHLVKYSNEEKAANAQEKVDVWLGIEALALVDGAEAKKLYDEGWRPLADDKIYAKNLWMIKPKTTNNLHLNEEVSKIEKAYEDEKIVETLDAAAASDLKSMTEDKKPLMSADDAFTLAATVSSGTVDKEE